ncbi:phosphoglucomutase (alpha-D-glucose-1,6-bisphosphate-dependent) [Zophobihabitans entericus]|uniref:Phosphoglucomutase n=1 Tax=Zophobihabitans entericus TaxID=1635327 RepID=A0A6G9IC29_9GAMM|nr:phosphoglucomutase (alpha-D-glucose-1,6-bisphosphate-dependent) [Zophobihabitans entericus]QIQ21785.1 alpha-D-glucose phosphate-specific phosphoglucomutase [Zophobihabitans entericus]
MTQKHNRAGQPAQAEDLIDVSQLIKDYYDSQPDASDASQLVIFGTSGHRGSSHRQTFNENHILAVAQAIADVRKLHKIDGPCFVGKDTHALSDLALQTVLEVFAANHIETVIAKDRGYTPTPVISHAIITYNQNRHEHFADGVVITPSHNPPEDGGIKYNWINGGPADTVLTKAIEQRANELLQNSLNQVKRVPLKQAQESGYIHEKQFEQDYINDLVNVIDIQAIADSTLNIGVDPLGGAGITYWQQIQDQYGLNLNIVNNKVDPTFSFMHLDHDNVIRMDCSSAYAMAGLLKHKNRFDLAFGNDTDFDRHGIVTPQGLMNPNAYLSVVANYLFQNRPDWNANVALGKTVVTSAMLNRVADSLEREFKEFPVGFKWYSEGLFSGAIGFACEESAGASFLRHNGKVWTTDKDGIILCLIAAEIMAKTGLDPQEHYKQLTDQFGISYYGRIQAPATFAEKQKLSKLDANQITVSKLAGEEIQQSLTTAPANDAPIGGLKVITENGWFAARPSGTEEAYKIYAESFVSHDHLKQLEDEAAKLISKALN